MKGKRGWESFSMRLVMRGFGNRFWLGECVWFLACRLRGFACICMLAAALCRVGEAGEIDFESKHYLIASLLVLRGCGKRSGSSISDTGKCCNMRRDYTRL